MSFDYETWGLTPVIASVEALQKHYLLFWPPSYTLVGYVCVNTAAVIYLL